MFLYGSNTLFAQGPMNHGKWEENRPAKNTSHKPAEETNEFSETEIAIQGKIVTFSNLPEKSRSVVAIVTDPTGEAILQKSISLQNNYLDLRRLSRGEMYFVTLVYKGKSRKGFVVHL